MSLEQLSPELVQKAKEELNEDPETRMHFIEELREKSKTRPDLQIEKADKDLIKFLRARKFDLDRAFELLVTYYETKRNKGELFSERYSPSAEIKAFETGFNIAFQDRDQEVMTINLLCTQQNPCFYLIIKMLHNVYVTVVERSSSGTIAKKLCCYHFLYF